MASLSGHVRPSQSLYFKEGATWSALSSGHFCLRYYPQGFLFDSKGQVAVGDKCWEILTQFNSNTYQMLANIIMPTLDYKCGDVKKLPYIKIDSTPISIAKHNVNITKLDWDAHETSWDFQRNELLSIDEDTYMENINYEIEKHFEETGEHICIAPAPPQLDSLAWRIEQYKTKWERKFMQLHKNEEELNRQFIDIYGLQDELTPDVPLSEITILQQGEISIESEQQ